MRPTPRVASGRIDWRLGIRDCGPLATWNWFFATINLDKAFKRFRLRKKGRSSVQWAAAHKAVRRRRRRRFSLCPVGHYGTISSNSERVSGSHRTMLTWHAGAGTAGARVSGCQSRWASYVLWGWAAAGVGEPRIELESLCSLRPEKRPCWQSLRVPAVEAAPACIRGSRTCLVSHATGMCSESNNPPCSTSATERPAQQRGIAPIATSKRFD